MQPLSVTIIAGSFERRRNNSGLLHAFTGFLLVLKTMEWLRKVPSHKQWIALIFLAIGLSVVVFGLMGKRIFPARYNTWSKRFFVLEGICFLALSILFIPSGKPVDFTFTIAWTLLCGFFYYSEKRIENPAVITLRDSGVTIPGILQDRLIPWNEIESVVLRSDFITINKKNNKYLQFELAEEDGESFREAFNTYARAKTE